MRRNLEVGSNNFLTSCPLGTRVAAGEIIHATKTNFSVMMEEQKNINSCPARVKLLPWSQTKCNKSATAVIKALEEAFENKYRKFSLSATDGWYKITVVIIPGCAARSGRKTDCPQIGVILREQSAHIKHRTLKISCKITRAKKNETRLVKVGKGLKEVSITQRADVSIVSLSTQEFHCTAHEMK